MEFKISIFDILKQFSVNGLFTISLQEKIQWIKVFEKSWLRLGHIDLFNVHEIVRLNNL